MNGFAKVVLDTGPLLSFVWARTVESMYLVDEDRDRALRQAHVDALASAAGRRALKNLYGRITRFLLTSHVIGELQGHTSRLPGAQREVFWSQAIRLLTEKRGDERLVTVLDLASADRGERLIRDIGPTDTGLIDLACKEDCPLITEDESTLAARAYERRVDCRLLKNLLPEYAS